MTGREGYPDNAGRRRFLKSSVIAAVVAPAIAAPALAENKDEAQASKADVPSDAQAVRETGPVPQPVATPPDGFITDPGSDFMVDLLRAVDIQYVAAMPGSTFRGLQESIVSYGGNKAPELITCVHEEISAAMCHGYAKVAGKPMACLVHSTVGLQHASMAIYNAWCDKAPVMVLAGNILDETKRRPGVEWLHTMTDLGSMVRDYCKWDDVPASLQHYADSFMRAYEIALTPPCAPVMLVVDADLQEEPIEDRKALAIPRRSPVSPPSAPASAIDRAASLLAGASAPVIVAERAARSAAGMALIVELAEALNAPVIDRGGRLNMPTTHYLNHSFRRGDMLKNADVVLALDVADIWGLVNTVPDLPVRKARRTLPENTKLIAISATYGFAKANVQDSQRYYPADLTLAADSEATLPQLIEAILSKLDEQKRQAIAAKRPAMEAEYRKMRAASAEEAALSWQASPIGIGRLCMEVWDQIKGLSWGLVSSGQFASNWPQRLWDFTEHHQLIGDAGGYGVGYGAPAAAGAALAHRDAGRIAVAIQPDGDLLVLPGTLWTLAHHRIPLLMVMHNNRAFHQETMHLQRMASWRQRGVDKWRIGTVLDDPVIDYASVARGFGVWAEGPITHPDKLRGALSRALAVVKSGKPALIDVVTQPR